MVNFAVAAVFASSSSLPVKLISSSKLSAALERSPS